MKLLISLVGKRDPYGDGGSEGSILTVAREVAPGRVHLLASPDTEENARHAQAALQTELRITDVRIHHLALEDVTDYDEIGRVMPAALRDAIFRADDAEIHYAASSGTAQMRTSLLVLLQELRLRGRDIRLWETRAPEYVTAAHPRVRPFEVPVLDHGFRSARFEQAWRTHNFPAAALLLRDQLAQRSLAPGAALLRWAADLADAYACWDAVNWSDAHDKLTSLLAQIDIRSPVAPLRPRLTAQHDLLPRLLAAQSSGEEEYWSMLDLYHNAHRRLESSQFVDALVRWQRVLEGALYAYVRGLPGCAIGTNGELTVEGELRDGWLAFRAKQYEETMPPTRAEARIPDLLFLAQRTGRLPKSFIGAINGANQARNKTIATHGIKPVDGNMVRTALTQLAGILTNLFPTEAAAHPPNDYPLSSGNLVALGEDLARILREHT